MGSSFGQIQTRPVLHRRDLQSESKQVKVHHPSDAETALRVALNSPSACGSAGLWSVWKRDQTGVPVLVEGDLSEEVAWQGVADD